ncbi:MAG: hypothetical protein GY953_55980, partial [bacterium]|nr:hypothetical protein [bacterium]
EPGEQATVWIKHVQGMDPFDKHNWCRAKLYSDSQWISEVDDIQEQRQREWTGAFHRSNVVRLSAEAPRGTRIPALLSTESWSFHFTPDVRYGAEPLLQGFQLHEPHLHRWHIEVPAN